MNTKRRFAAFLAMIMISISAYATADTLKIGQIGPTSGAAAVYGQAVLNGAKIAVEEINALGGVQLELNAQDDEHDAEKSVNAYNTLMDAGVQMILGTVTTTPCLAVAAVAAEDQTFLLTPSASAPDVLANAGNTTYQVCFTDPAQGTASADYIAEHQLAKNIGVIYNNGDAYSTGVFDRFQARAAELGLNIVAESTFTDETTDFSVQVAAMKNAGADLVFLPIYYTPASMILNQANATDYKPMFFGVDGMDGLLSLKGFDKSLAEGVMLLTPFSADAQDEKTVKFVTRYQELYGEVPNQFAADAYDGIYALYLASQAGGVTEADDAPAACAKLMEAFKTLEVDGITGKMGWSETGEVTKTPTAVIIRNGVYVGAENGAM